MDKGDHAAIASMKAGYLQRVYGRMIPQVLPTHMGAWGAATLPDVMKKLTRSARATPR